MSVRNHFVFYRFLRTFYAEKLINLHYCSCPTARDSSAVYPAFFINGLRYVSLIPLIEKWLFNVKRQNVSLNVQMRVETWKRQNMKEPIGLCFLGNRWRYDYLLNRQKRDNIGSVKRYADDGKDPPGCDEDASCVRSLQNKNSYIYVYLCISSRYENSFSRESCFRNKIVFSLWYLVC